MSQRSFVLVMLMMLLSIGHTNASQYRLAFPDTMTPVGQVKLCHSTFTGITQEYSCQDYQADHKIYRVIYRGGLVPKAIVAVDEQHNENLVWSTTFGDRKIAVPIPAPTGVPAEAVHYGTGVCQDEKDIKIPCSVYEHRVARKKAYHRYMVFYTPNGSGPLLIDEQVAGSNKNAMVAEIAYQLGLSLFDTNCCSEKAMAYLELAHRLFPNAVVYHKAYEHARSVMVSDESHADND